MINVAFILLVLLQLMTIIFISNISKRPYFSWVRGSVLDPLIFINAIILIFLFDYIIFYNSNLDFVIYEEHLPVERTDVLVSYLFVSIGFIFLTVGLAAGSVRQVGRSRFLEWLNDLLTPVSSGIVYYGVAVFVVVGVAMMGGLVSSQVNGELSRQVIFNENKLLLLGFGLLIPSYAAHISTLRDKKMLILASVICLVLLAISGSRGWIIYALLVFAYSLRFTVIKISAIYYVILLPVAIVFLLVSRYYFRESWRYSGFFEFLSDKNGVLGVFFETTEISMAEVLSTVFAYSGHLDRKWYDGILSGLMYFVPRDFAPFKPLGVDGFVTAEFSPDRWFWTKSEVTVTLFADLYIHFGALVSLVMLLLIGYAIARAVGAGLQYERLSPLLLPVTMWTVYILIRSGSFNGVGPVWFWVAAIFLNYIVKRFRVVSSS